MPAKKKVSFTVRMVSDLKSPERGKAILWDDAVPGLGVRVTSNGAKSFIFELTRSGKTYRSTIWAVPTALDKKSLEKARAEARRLVDLVERGIDPKEEERAKKAAQEREKMTVQTAWDRYIKHMKPVWSDRHYKDHLYLSTESEKTQKVGVLVSLLDLPLGDVNLRALTAWIESAKDAPSLSPQNKGHHSDVLKGFVRFKAFWRWAHGRPEEFGELAHPYMFNNGDLKRLLPEKRVKEDILQASQLEAWFREVRKLSNPIISAFLQCALVTGARRNEIGTLKWENVDFQWKTMTIRDKVDGERILPLTPYIEYLISPLKRRNEWVFSTAFKTSNTGRLAEPRIAHRRALEAAGLPNDLTLHGLRRTFITHSEKIGMPVGVCNRIVGHAPNTTAERHYIRRDIDTLRLWLEKYEDWFVETAKIPFDKQAATEGIHLVKDSSDGA